MFHVICLLLWTVDTEIDWIAYMEEVGGFLKGERVYTNLGVRSFYDRNRDILGP